jgi:hypothetical protein
MTTNARTATDWRQTLARRIRALRREAHAVAQTPTVACSIVRRRLERGESVPQWLWTAAVAEVRAIEARTAGVELVAQAWEAVARKALVGSP